MPSVIGFLVLTTLAGIVPGTALTFLGLSVSYAAAASFIGATVLAAAFIGIGLLLMPSPLKVDGQLNVAQAIPFRRRIYGRAKVGGYFAFYDSVKSNLYSVVMIASQVLDAFESHWLGDREVTVNGSNQVTAVVFPPGASTTQFGTNGKNVSIYFQTGAPGKTAYSALTSAFSLWDTNAIGRGIADALIIQRGVDQTSFSNVYPGGPQAYRTICRGAQVQNPTSLTSPATLAWTDNAVSVILDYLISQDGWRISDQFLLKGQGLAITQAAFAVANQTVSLHSGGSEARYRIWGFYDFDEEPRQVLARMLAACGGWLQPMPDGTIGINVGVWQSPTVTIDDDNILGYEVQHFTGEFDSVNEIRAQFIDPNNDYQSAEPQPWDNDADIARRGYIKSTTIDARHCPSFTQARRVMKIAAAEANPEWTIQLVTNAYGLAARGQRWINLTISELSLSITCRITSFVFNIQAGTCNIGLASFPSSSYDWNPATEEGVAPPTYQDTSNTSIVEQPISFAATVTLASAAGLTQGGYISLQCAQVSTRVDLLAEFQISTDAGLTWSTVSTNVKINASNLYACKTALLPYGTYAAQVRFFAANSVQSLYTGITGIVVSAIFAPTAVAGLAVAVTTAVTSTEIDPALAVTWTATSDTKVTSITFEYEPTNAPTGTAQLLSKTIPFNAAHQSGTQQVIISDGVLGGVKYQVAAAYNYSPAQAQVFSSFVSTTGTTTSTVAGGTSQATIGVNRVPYSLFESGASIGWMIQFNPVPLVITSSIVTASGLTYLKYAMTATGSGQQVNEGSDQFPVTANETLACQGTIEISSNCTGGLFIGFYNAAGAQISFTQIGTTLSTANTPTLKQAFVVVPAGAVSAQYQFAITSTGSGAFSGQQAQPFVSGANSTQTAYPAFNPGPNAAAGADVTGTVMTIGVNRVLLSQFEGGPTDAWAIDYDPNSLSPITPTLSTNAGVVTLNIAQTATGAAQPTAFASDLIPVIAGETLALSGLITTTANCTAQWAFGFVNASDVLVTSGNIGASVPASSTAVVRNAMVVVPAGAVWGYLQLYGTSVASGAFTYSLGQPMMAGAVANQTQFPNWNPGPNADPGADVTAEKLTIGVNRVQLSLFESGPSVGWFDAFNPVPLTVTPTVTTVNGLPTLTYSQTATAGSQSTSFATDVAIPVIAGEDLAISGYLTTSANCNNSVLVIDFYNSSGSNVSSVQVGATVLASHTQVFTSGFVPVPATAVSAYLQVYGTSTASGAFSYGLAHPNVAGALYGQTQQPVWTAGPNATSGADVTANNTAAGIANQAPAATDPTIQTGATVNQTFVQAADPTTNQNGVGGTYHVPDGALWADLTNNMTYLRQGGAWTPVAPASTVGPGSVVVNTQVTGSGNITLPSGSYAHVDIYVFGIGGNGIVISGKSPHEYGGSGASTSIKTGFAVTPGTTVISWTLAAAVGTASTCTATGLSLSVPSGINATSSGSAAAPSNATGGTNNYAGHAGGLTNAWDGGGCANSAGGYVDQTQNFADGLAPGGGGSGSGTGAAASIVIILRT